MGNDPINGIDPDGGFKWKWWAKTVNFLIGGDGVEFSKYHEEYYVKKFTNFSSSSANELDGIGIEAFFSTPIKVYGNARANADFGLQGGFDLNFAGADIALEGGHDVFNLADINLDLNSQTGFSDSYIYNRYGSRSANLGDYSESERSRKTYLGIGLGVVSGETEWETSRLGSERILGGYMRGVGNLKSESLSFPVYGTNTTNYNNTTQLTTTTRSWSIGASVKALLGLHANAEIGYELQYNTSW
jgi:hypothetical protein